MVTVSSDLQQLFFRTRSRVLDQFDREDYKHKDPVREKQRRLFAQLNNWFPMVKKGERKREIRLGILMAMIGYPISSQSELPEQIVDILTEVTNDTSTYLTRELSTELQEVIASQTDGAPWLLPVADPEVLAMPDL